jgi:hypothetical protein
MLHHKQPTPHLFATGPQEYSNEAAAGLSGTKEATFIARGGPDLCLVLLHPDPRQPLHKLHSMAGFRV